MKKSPVLLFAAIGLILVGLVGIAVSLLYQPLSGGVGAGGVRTGMDAMFIEQMIPHHDDAIAMSDLALTRAEHPELKRLAQSIKRTQTAENVQMREWYSLWFGRSVPAGSRGSRGGMMGGMMGGETMDLDLLESSASFDKAFLEQMIPHHQMAIMMSQMAGGATQRAEMRAFTQSIIDTQSREIVQMQAWYQDWYGRR